jgi:hypothetical protein
MSSYPAAIEPLALIFPTRIYLILMEILHPNTPLTDALPKALAQANAEERAFIGKPVKAITAICHAVEAAART